MAGESPCVAGCEGHPATDPTALLGRTAGEKMHQFARWRMHKAVATGPLYILWRS